MDEATIKRVVEGILFVTDKPVSLDQFKEVLGAETKEIKAALEILQQDYESQNRGIEVREVAGGYQVTTRPDLAEHIKSFVMIKDRRKLTPASLETLSIIAYKQPITRQEIEFIRGVNVDGAIKTLLEKSLIRMAGRKEVPGRPLLYTTTKDFLNYLGLASLKELPKLAEFTEKDIALPETLKGVNESISEPIHATEESA